MKRRLGTSERHAQRSQDVRVRAQGDIGNFVSAAAGALVVTELLRGESETVDYATRLFNVDESLQRFGTRDTTTVVRKRERERPVTVTDAVPRGEFYLGVILFSAADGVVGPVTVIIKTGNVDAAHFDADTGVLLQEVSRYAPSLSTRDHGYWMWLGPEVKRGDTGVFDVFFERVFVPHCNSIRGSVDEAVYLQVDGDASHLTAALEPSRRTRTLLTTHNIMMGKSPASTTALLQPMDVCSFFKDMHQLAPTALSQMKADLSYGTLMDICHGVQDMQLERAYGTHLQESLACLLHIVSKRFLPSVTRVGFRKTGIFPLNAETTLRSCEAWSYADVATQQRAHEMIAPAAVSIRTTGVVNEELFAGTEWFQRGLATKALKSQRFALLSHESVVAASDKKRKAAENAVVEKKVGCAVIAKSHFTCRPRKREAMPPSASAKRRRPRTRSLLRMYNATLNNRSLT